MLILLVLSNDLHELVFDFPEDGLQMYLFNNHHYGPVFYCCLAWEGVLYLAAFLITVSKCRRTQERSTLLLPLIPVFLLLGNVLLHLGHNPISHVLLGDLPVFVCLMIVLFLELCIHVGVIRSNTGYEELFARGTLGAQLLDRQGRLIYTSLNNWNIPEEVKQKVLREGSAELDSDTLIECHPIRGGYVLWKKDISELTAILEKLSDNEEELSGRLELEQKNYETRLAIEEYREENRLYDLLRESNATRVSAMKDLLDRFTKETDPVLRQKMLHKAAILTSYVKRRGNLLLIGEKKHRVELQELYLCFRESLSNLELSGANCAVQFEKEGFLRFSDALRLYDFYEEIAEQAGEGVNALLVKLWVRDRSLAPDHATVPKTASLRENEAAGSDGAGRRQGIFRIEAECASDLSRALDLADEGGIEDGIWHFDIHVHIYNEEGARV